MAKKAGGASRPSLFGRIGINLRRIVESLLKPIQYETPRVELPIEEIEPEEPEETEEDETPETAEEFTKRIGITERSNYSPGDLDRGPYYSHDQFMSKLQGMRGAWHYIVSITLVRTGGIDRYYIRIDDRTYNKSSRHTGGSGRRSA